MRRGSLPTSTHQEAHGKTPKRCHLEAKGRDLALTFPPQPKTEMNPTHTLLLGLQPPELFKHLSLSLIKQNDKA